MDHSASDHLHRLIRSMTGPEKRYFKIHSAHRSSEAHTIQQNLFDTLANTAIYNEKAVLKKFQGASSLNHFTTTKHRLYEAVLKSLGAYHAERSIDARIAKLLSHVGVLHDKALYADAERLLTTAERLARQHERTPALLAVLKWEQRLVERGNYAHATEQKLQKIAEEGTNTLRQAAELDRLWNLKSVVLMTLYRDGQARSPVAMSAMTALLAHPLLQRPETLRSARARFLFHHVHSAAAFACGERERCMTHLELAYQVLEKDRPKFMEEPNLAFSVLSNMIYMKVNTGHFEDAFALLHDFRLLPNRWNMPENEDLDLKLFATSTSLELTIHTRMGRFDKALELLPLVERGLAQHEQQLGAMRKASFYYQLAYANLGAGQPQQALRWTNKLLNDIRMDETAEIVGFGRILHLLAQLDAEKLDLLPYNLRNTMRFLATRNRMHRFEPLLLAMVRGVLKARNNEARRTVYATFLERAAPLEADPFERAVFDHLDPIAWVESKLTGRPFAELVQERAKRAALAA